MQTLFLRQRERTVFTQRIFAVLLFYNKRLSQSLFKLLTQLFLYKRKAAHPKGIRTRRIEELSLAHGAEATSTNRQRLRRAVNRGLYLANVGLPSSVGMTVGVRYSLTENNALSANFTLCHVSIPNLS